MKCHSSKKANLEPMLSSIHLILLSFLNTSFLRLEVSFLLENTLILHGPLSLGRLITTQTLV